MKKLLVFLCALALFFCQQAYGTSIKYTVTQLGVLDGGTYSEARAINNLGQVVGYSQAKGEEAHAVLWDPNDGIQDIGISSSDASVAYDINNNGQVVGTLRSSGYTVGQFMWDEANGLRVIMPDGGIAPSVNDFGQVAIHTYLWDPVNGAQNIGVGSATSINNQGQIVGRTLGYPYYAYIWDSINGVQTLGTFGDREDSWAFDVNDLGQMVGCVTNPGSAIAFYWDSEVGMVSIGTLEDASHSRAEAINIHGQVVGTSYDEGAFIWSQEAGILNLNDQLSEQSGQWYIEEAYDINDSGQIVGTGYMGPHGDDYSGAVLLTPVPAVPAPSTILLLASGILALAGVNRK